MPVSKKDVVFLTDEKFVPKNVTDVLLAYKANVMEALQKSLAGVERIATGELSQSIAINIETAENSLSFVLMMEDYWKYVESGVNGTSVNHGSPFKFKKKNIKQFAVRRFMYNRGITKLEWKDKDGSIVTLDANRRLSKKKTKGLDKGEKKALKVVSKEAKLNQIAYVLGRNIAKKGLKPTHFYSNVINENFKQIFKDNIRKAFFEDVYVSVKEIKQQLNGNNSK